MEFLKEYIARGDNQYYPRPSLQLQLYKIQGMFFKMVHLLGFCYNQEQAVCLI